MTNLLNNPKYIQSFGREALISRLEHDSSFSNHSQLSEGKKYLLGTLDHRAPIHLFMWRRGKILPRVGYQYAFHAY